MPLVEGTPVGLNHLIERFGLRVPAPVVLSQVGPGARRTWTEDGRVTEHYPRSYAPDDSVAAHLKFALKNEPVDLGVLAAAFKAIDASEIEAWVRDEPNGAFARRAWFLYEWLTGKMLDVPDAGAVTYVEALDSGMHVTAKGVPSRRHKVTDNILGSPGFAPTVRRTPAIESFQAAAIDAEARSVVCGVDPEVLSRAVNYLYTKETKSSFAIENEVASGQRAERFVAALRAAGSFRTTDRDSLVDLQNTIVDPRYAAKGFRDFQNFVGETVGGYREVVHFICPKPEDVESLMADWSRMTARLKGTTDPVAAAALISFGFVFIHPFEDGNGRIHRFLMHHILSAEGFTPPDILFPVSAAIVRDRRGYDAALESFSDAVQQQVDWHWTEDKEIEVENDTADLYRYFDATNLVEFLYAKVAETIRKDLKEELDFVTLYDSAMNAVRDIVDMPDRRASLLVRFCLQNGGSLSTKRRGQFKELSDHEVSAMETAIHDILDEHGAASGIPMHP